MVQSAPESKEGPPGSGPSLFYFRRTHLPLDLSIHSLVPLYRTETAASFLSHYSK